MSEFTFKYFGLYSLPEPENEDNFDEDDHSSRPSDPQGPEAAELPLAAVEHQVDVLLEEWNKGADMLFSIHPMDGSLLVWHVDWLDEYQPGMFRQAQVNSLSMWFKFVEELNLCCFNQQIEFLAFYMCTGSNNPFTFS